MTILLAALALVVPLHLDLPPEIDTAAVATATAERGTAVQVTETLPPPVEVVAPPPPPAAPAGMSDCDEMSWYRQRAGLPARFDQLGWRESNCRQELGVHTSCCWGWLQLNVSLHLRDHRLVDRYHRCGVYSVSDANGPDDKARHMCAAKALYDVVGYSAWSTS
jgi:hypothetical protein